MSETTPDATTVNDANPDTTGADKDYAKLYENSKAEIARKEAKYKADVEARKVEREELEAYRKEKEARAEKDKISKGKQNEIIEEMKTKYADYDDLKSFKQSVTEKQEAEITKQLESIPEDEKEFVTKVITNAKSISEKSELLKGFTERFLEKKDRGKEPAKATPVGEKTELEKLELKKENGKLTPTEKVKYLTLLSGK